MTKVVFENATIRDVIGKASRISPTKSGDAFEKATGILMEVNPDAGHVIVKATDTEIFYMEITDAVSIEGPATRWRLPSSYLDGICSKLPIASGQTVALDDENGNAVKIVCGKMRANLRTMDPQYFPKWGAFDPKLLSPVSGFGGRIQQVQWAASKNGTPPITGIHLDGERLVATDRFKVATVPCEIPHLYEAVTIPASMFTPLMKHLGEVSLGQEEGMLLVMPDENTQIRANIYAGSYPNVMQAFKRDETNAVMVKKSYLVEMIDRALVMGQQDRTPILRVIIGYESLSVMMEDQEMGVLGEEMDLPGQATHEYHTIGFNPDNFKGALQASPNEDVTLYYSFGKPRKSFRLDGGSGYEVIVQPRSLERSQEEQ